jgi:uncharacterized Tic20 family protein
VPASVEKCIFRKSVMNTPTSDERTIAMLSHILAIIPGIGILGPLIIYLVKNQDSAFVAHHAKESLNFQITVILAYIISGVLMLVLIGFFLFWVIGIVNTILVIVATIKTSENQLYTYPFSLRIV